MARKRQGMDTEETRLADVGVRLAGDTAPQAYAECIRIARRLLIEQHKVIGFIPVGDRIGVPGVAIQLGMALVELSGATAAYVDANLRYPALDALAHMGEGEVSSEDDSFFRTRWLKGSLALLTPNRAERAGEAVPALASLLLSSAEIFAHVLVDLTGFELLGEHASAAACVDGVVLVGRAHKTREKDLLQFVDNMPGSQFLGVLLVD